MSKQLLLEEELMKRLKPKKTRKPRFPYPYPQPQIDWSSVLWKTILVEIGYIIAKIVYGVWVTAELVKKHPEMVIPEYFSIFSWQTWASPGWMFTSWLYPQLTGEDLRLKTRQTLRDINPMLPYVDDFFGEYTYYVMLLIPVIIVLLEYLKVQKQRKEIKLMMATMA